MTYSWNSLYNSMSVNHERFFDCTNYHPWESITVRYLAVMKAFWVIGYLSRGLLSMTTYITFVLDASSLRLISGFHPQTHQHRIDLDLSSTQNFLLVFLSTSALEGLYIVHGKLPVKLRRVPAWPHLAWLWLHAVPSWLSCAACVSRFNLYLAVSLSIDESFVDEKCFVTSSLQRIGGY